jgi:hypothetical protein
MHSDGPTFPTFPTFSLFFDHFAAVQRVELNANCPKKIKHFSVIFLEFPGIFWNLLEFLGFFGFF